MQQNAEPIIQIKNTNKFFDDFQALKNISLDIYPDERVILCGPSGSGKSTLIRLINRLEEHDSGTIIVNGVELTSDIKSINRVRADVGMVFQHFNLFPHMTVLQNCIVAQKIVKNRSQKEARDIAMSYLERVRIPEQADKYPGQLSGGQQQRVAIARSLSLNPKIMLFDEPTSALDPEMVKEVLDTMVELTSDGMTMICVTHEMHFARQVGDRIIFMDAGEIVETATPEAFFANPSTSRAREFIGQINF